MAGAKRVHHATVLVADLDKADEFYSGVLGLAKIPRPSLPSKGIWYELAGVQLHLICAVESEAVTARHVAFVVDDLDTVLAAVKEMGLPIWSDIQVRGFVRKHCRDPFGNGIELLQSVASDFSAPEETTSCVDRDGKWQVD